MPSSASVRRWNPSARPFAAIANGNARTRAPANESIGSHRCGPKSPSGASTIPSSTCTKSRWFPRRPGRPRRAISRRMPPSSSPPTRMASVGRTGRVRRRRPPNRNAVRIGVKATTALSRVLGPRRPHRRPPPSVRRTAKAGRSPIGNPSPADGMRRRHRPQPGPSDSSRSHRDVHIDGPRRRRGLSSSLPRRLRSQRRNHSPSRHRRSRGFPGHPLRMRPARRSRRPGSRSIPRASGRRPGRPAATGTPARPTAPGRRRGRTTTGRHATGKSHTAGRASANRRRRRPRRLNDVGGIPAHPPTPRPANPPPTGVSLAAVPDPGIPLTIPTPA